MRTPARILTTAWVSLLSGCLGSGTAPPCLSLEAPPIAGGPVLAQVGNTELHAAHLLPLREDERRADGGNALLRRLEDRVRFELLAQAAWRENFGRDPEVIEAARQVMVRRYLQAKVPLIGPEEDLDETTLRRAYEVNRHLYLKPELRRLDVISLRDGPQGHRLGVRLLQNLQAGLAPAEAIELAVHPPRRAPDARPYTGPVPHVQSLPFRSERELTQKLGQLAAQEIFALAPETWGPTLISTPRGLWLVRVAARRADASRSFEEVREELVALLTRQRRSEAFAQLIERLRNEREVALFAERVEALVQGQPPPQAPVARGVSPLTPNEAFSPHEDDAQDLDGRAGLKNVEEVQP